MIEIELSVDGEAKLLELENPKLTSGQVHQLVRGFLCNYGRVRMLDLPDKPEGRGNGEGPGVFDEDEEAAKKGRGKKG